MAGALEVVVIELFDGCVGRVTVGEVVCKLERADTRLDLLRSFRCHRAFFRRIHGSPRVPTSLSRERAAPRQHPQASLASRPSYFFFGPPGPLGYRNDICSLIPHGDPPTGCTAFPKNEADAFTGWYPSRKTRDIPPPTGTVQTFPLEACQLAVIVGDIEIAQPFCRL